MSFERRDFLKLCAGTMAGLGASQMAHPSVLAALEKAASGKTPCIWLQGCGCTGCSVSILNSVHPSIADVLLKIISMEYHPTIMGCEGETAFEHMLHIAEENQGKFILFLEGSIPTKDERYCIIGEAHEKEYSLGETLRTIAPKAAACVALGACATYGGIPGAKGNLTGCVGLAPYLQQQKIKAPVVNIPGCAPHPDWMVGTLAFALENGLDALVKNLDEHGRPKMFFGKNIHDNCPYLPAFESEKFAEDFNKPGCKYALGCKGPASSSDCYKRIWNSGVNWCVENSVCIGCVEPGWPDSFSPFYEEL